MNSQQPVAASTSRQPALLTEGSAGYHPDSYREAVAATTS